MVFYFQICRNLGQRKKYDKNNKKKRGIFI